MFLKAGDVISGQEAVGRMTIKKSDGTSQVEDMLWAKKIEAKAEINKTPIRTLGKRGEQNKPAGWKGSGSMTIYYVTSLFRRMIMQYIKTGVPVYFDMLVTNDDPASSIGRQTVLLKNCSIDSAILTSIDVDADALDESVDFTFDDAELLEEFSAPTYGV